MPPSHSSKTLDTNRLLKMFSILNLKETMQRLKENMKKLRENTPRKEKNMPRKVKSMLMGKK